MGGEGEVHFTRGINMEREDKLVPCLYSIGHIRTSFTVGISGCSRRILIWREGRQGPISVLVLPSGVQLSHLELVSSVKVLILKFIRQD